ncbi:hypothetical protein ACJJTC_008132 [Scirpophaga incertulas]
MAVAMRNVFKATCEKELSQGRRANGAHACIETGYLFLPTQDIFDCVIIHDRAKNNERLTIGARCSIYSFLSYSGEHALSETTSTLQLTTYAKCFRFLLGCGKLKDGHLRTVFS